jgi:hypothetical protein
MCVVVARRLLPGAVVLILDVDAARQDDRLEVGRRMVLFEGQVEGAGGRK